LQAQFSVGFVAKTPTLEDNHIKPQGSGEYL